MRFSVKGTLSDSKFIEILNDAANVGLTGMIRLENGPTIKVVYIQKGTISFASSNDKKDRLTEVLKRAGKLTPAQVEDAQARLKPNVSLGKTLVELGYISAKDLLWGARAQVDGILHELLFWNQGKYQLMEGTLPREIIHLNLPVPAVLFEGIMKTQDRDWILQRIGTPETIYQISKNFREKIEKLNLPVSAVTSQIDGKRSLHEIAQKSDLDTFELCKTVVALEYLDLVHPVQNEPLQMQLDAIEEEELLSIALEDQPVPTEVEGTRKIAHASTLKQTEKLKPVPAQQVKPGISSDPAVVELVEDPPQQRTQPFVKKTIPVQAPPVTKTPEPETQITPPRYEPAPSTEKPEYTAIKDDTPLIGDRSSFNWRALTIILLVVGSVGLGVLYYLRYLNYPTVRPRAVSRPSTAPQQQPPSTPPPQANPAPEVSAPVESTTEPEPPLQTAVPIDEPLTLLKTRKIPAAARSWRKEIAKNRSGYSIQVVIACQEQTVLDTHQLLNYSKDIMVLPVIFKGQNCYRVLLGRYPSRQQAQAAVNKLPDVFIQQRSPANVVLMSQVN